MNDDLISREWLKDAFDNLCCHNCKTCRNFRNEDSFYKCNLIDNAPTINPTITCKECDGYEAGYSAGQHDARPQGHWEVKVNDLNKVRTIHCSICDYHFEAWRDRPNFCPNCGAEMHGGGE